MDQQRHPYHRQQQGPMQPAAIGLPLSLPSPAFTHEVLPGNWTSEVAMAAWAHASESFPQESLGVVVPGRGYMRLANASKDPENFGHVPEGEIALLLTEDSPAERLLFVHSHPNGLQCPSEIDMRSQRAWGIPFVVLPVRSGGPAGRAFAWGHETRPAPFEGRPFRHGIFDCVSLIRDWYQVTRGISFVDEPRDWEWWTTRPDLDLYRACYARERFRAIDISEATQPGDVILYAIRSKVPQHGAVVVDKDVILHHPAGAMAYDPGRRSTMDLRSRWHRFAIMAVRHA